MLAILLVAFGSSKARARKAYENIEQQVRNQYPKIPISWAYSSNRMHGKSNSDVPTIDEALTQLKGKFSEVAVLPIYLTASSEYYRTVEIVDKFKPEFKQLAIAEPLINSATDLKDFLGILNAIVPVERKSGEEIIFMGHGSKQAISGINYAELGHELNRIDPKFYLATIDGKPSFPELLECIDSVHSDSERVIYLVPLLIISGWHVEKDLLGDNDRSWKVALQQRGIKTIEIWRGLGEITAIANLFVGHLNKAIKKLKLESESVE